MALPRLGVSHVLRPMVGTSVTGPYFLTRCTWRPPCLPHAASISSSTRVLSRASLPALAKAQKPAASRAHKSHNAPAPQPLDKGKKPQYAGDQLAVTEAPAFGRRKPLERSSVRFAEEARASQVQAAQELGTESLAENDSALSDDPLVVYRSSPTFDPKNMERLTMFSLVGGFLAAVAVGFGLPSLVPSWLPVADEEVKELGDKTIRIGMASACVFLGLGGAAYCQVTQMRTITRITLHLKSGLVGLRTVRPSAAWWAPSRTFLPEFSGLNSPFSTVDGRLGSKPDKRVRVFSLENVFQIRHCSPTRFFARNDLLPHELKLLEPYLPEAQNRPSVNGPSMSTAESALSDDNSYLLVRPHGMLWTFRASGGRVPRDRRPFWQKAFPKGEMLPTDYSDLTPTESKALRAKGDAYINHLSLLLAKKHHLHPGAVRDEIMPEGLTEQQVWFRDRKNFDELFPVYGD